MTMGAAEHDVLSLTERISFNRPRSHVILLAECLDVDTLQRAMKAGARNVAPFPGCAKEFCAYIKKVYHDETSRIQSLGEGQA
jgi:DNA-binding NtrC family response regulator